MITTTQAIEQAAEQIVNSMNLNVRFSGTSVDDIYLEDGGIALIVLENQLILGEIRQKTAHMDGYEVLNVDVAGELVYRTFYYDDSRPSRTELVLQFESVHVSSF